MGSPRKSSASAPANSSTNLSPGDTLQPIARQLNFLKPIAHHADATDDKLTTYAGATARSPPLAMTRKVPPFDHHYTARNDAVVALQYLISDQQRRDEAQRQREDAREAARCKREDEREAARRQHDEHLRAEQHKRDEQRDQQFTQLSQLLASLTTLVVKSNDNQAQLLERQNRLE